MFKKQFKACEHIFFPNYDKLSRLIGQKCAVCDKCNSIYDLGLSTDMLNDIEIRNLRMLKLSGMPNPNAHRPTEYLNCVRNIEDV